MLQRAIKANDLDALWGVGRTRARSFVRTPHTLRWSPRGGIRNESTDTNSRSRRGRSARIHTAKFGGGGMPAGRRRSAHGRKQVGGDYSCCSTTTSRSRMR